MVPGLLTLIPICQMAHCLFPRWSDSPASGGEVWEDSMAQETIPVSSQRSWLALTLSFENLSSEYIFQNQFSSQILKMAVSEEPVTHCGSHWILLLPSGFTFSFCCLLPFSLLFNSTLMGHELHNSTSNGNIKTAYHEAEDMAQLVKMLTVQVLRSWLKAQYNGAHL